MGSVDSANDEWIELYNDSEQVRTLDGWRLTDGQSLAIELIGTIAAGAYAVLERTDDDSASGSAFLIYTGALPNTGATLKLLDANGTLVDQVAGGDNWELIGGDNTTKETAQLTTGGWVTALPTPGTRNTTLGIPKDTSDSDDTNPSSSSGPLAKPVVRSPQFVPSTKELGLTVLVPQTIYVNQPVTFAVQPSDIGDTIVRSLTYEWNFGDLATSSGKRTTHTYRYPGQYIVTVRGHFARHDTIVNQPVTVLPVRFSLTQNSAGDIQIHNDAPYDVDVSGFALIGGTTLLFPERSLIPRAGTITVPAQKFGGVPSGVARLADARGTTVAHLGIAALAQERPARLAANLETEAVSPTDKPSVRSPVVSEDLQPVSVSDARQREVSMSQQFSFGQTNPSIGESEIPVKEALSIPDPIETDSLNSRDGRYEEPSLAANVITTDLATTDDLWPLLGLLSVVALGLVSVYFGASKT